MMRKLILLRLFGGVSLLGSPMAVAYDSMFIPVDFQPGDLPPEQILQIADGFCRTLPLRLETPPRKMELGRWRTYAYRRDRLWRLEWPAPHGYIELWIDGRSGEIMEYNNASASWYRTYSNRRGDLPQVTDREALRLAEHYLQAMGGFSVPMVLQGIRRRVTGLDLAVGGVGWKEKWTWLIGWKRVYAGVPWYEEGASLNLSPYTGELEGFCKWYWSPDPTHRVYVDAALAVGTAARAIRERGYPDPGPPRNVQLLIVHPNNSWGNLPQFREEGCPEARIAWAVSFPYVNRAGLEMEAALMIDAEENLVIGAAIPMASLEAACSQPGFKLAFPSQIQRQARKELGRLQAIQVQSWAFEWGKRDPWRVKQGRISGEEPMGKQFQGLLRASRLTGESTNSLPTWRFIFYRRDGTFFRGAYCPGDGRLQLEDYRRPGEVVLLWPPPAFESQLIRWTLTGSSEKFQRLRKDP